MNRRALAQAPPRLPPQAERVPAVPDYRGLALLVLSVAAGVALVVLATAQFIQALQ